MCFGLLANADVSDRCGHQNSFGAFQWAQHDLDWKFAAVLSPPGEFNAGTDLLGKRVLRGTQLVGDQPFREALRDDLLHLLAQQFIVAIAETLLCLQVQQYDLSGTVYHHHGIGSCFQQPAVLRLRLFVAAEVVAGLTKSAEVPSRVQQSDVGNVRQKPGPVLSHPDTFFFVPAVDGGDPKNLFWPASLNVLGREKTGEIATNSLLGCVAAHSLRANVPADNLALGVQHEDCVIFTGVHQDPIFLVTILKCLFGKAAREALSLHAPPCGNSDKYAQDHSQGQANSGLPEATLAHLLANC